MTKSEITGIVLAQFSDDDGFDHKTRDRIIRTCIVVRNTTQKRIETTIDEIKSKNND